MRKFIVFILLLFVCLAGHATVRIYSSSWSRLVGHKTLSVQLSLDKIKYKKTRPFKEFLYKAKRAENWEAQSLDYFIFEFNERTLRLDFEIIPADKQQTEYKLVLIPDNVTGGGKISGNAVLLDTRNNEKLFSFTFESLDGDDDDEITLRDAMKDLGKDFGKLFYKFLKKL